MALTPAVVSSPRVGQSNRNVRLYSGGLGASDNNVIVQIDDASEYRHFLIHHTTGATDVFVSLDGTNYNTSAVSLTDLGSASFATAVVVTAANRLYRLDGCFQKIRVLQNGATAPENVAVLCYR